VPFIVTGISQDGDTTALESTLKASGLPLDAFDVLGPDDSALTVSAGSALADSGIITGAGLDTGTGVPGISGTGIPGITSAPGIIGSTAGDSLWDRLADLAIPDDEVENYVDVLEAGRSIVAYHGNAANIAKVESVFRDAGLTKIKTF
jgi:hypothetical protein